MIHCKTNGYITLVNRKSHIVNPKPQVIVSHSKSYDRTLNHGPNRTESNQIKPVKRNCLTAKHAKHAKTGNAAFASCFVSVRVFGVFRGSEPASRTKSDQIKPLTCRPSHTTHNGKIGRSPAARAAQLTHLNTPKQTIEKR